MSAYMNKHPLHLRRNLLPRFFLTDQRLRFNPESCSVFGWPGHIRHPINPFRSVWKVLIHMCCQCWYSDLGFAVNWLHHIDIGSARDVIYKKWQVA